MRSAPRLLIVTAAATALASCMDVAAPSAASRRSLSIVPRFSESATLASAALAQAGVSYDSVRIVIVRPSTPPDTLKDTTIVFGPGSPEVTLRLSVAAIPSEDLVAGVDFTQGGVVIFRGSATVKALSPASAPTATPIEVEVDYTGPGSTVATVDVAPGAGLYSASSTTQFTATAKDAIDTVIAAPIFWSVSDPTKATISATGLLTPTGNRGTINVTATAANGVSKSVAVQLAPAATGLRVVQGAGQAGAPGSTLPVPVIVELIASDGLPAAGTGQTVTFSASAGASITPASTTLDANGRASATMTVGGTAGTTYIFTAQVGANQIQWGETAKPGTPTHFVSNTSTTLTLTAGVTPNPIPTIRVADALENSVSGVFLKVTIKEGGVDLPGTPLTNVPADSVGLLEVYKVAPTKAGSYTILVETQDPALGVPSVTYSVTVNPGAASKLAFTQQPPATVTSGQPITVKVTIQDQFGNTVTSATNSVSLSVEPGSAGWTVTGSASAVGGVATISATITKTGAAVSGAKLQATSGTLGTALSSAFSIP